MENPDDKLPFTFRNKEIPADLQSQNWMAIQRTITQEPLTGKPVSKARILVLSACLLGLLFAGIWLNYRQEPPAIKNVASNYGEVKTITLPDSSTIVLNGHSFIRIPTQWGTDQPREVWLEGEAFFSIRHINTDKAHVQPGERFLVHCADLTVEVLGTSFDIRQRRGKTEVVLQSGSISLTFNNQPQRKLLMKPGQIVVYTKEENKLVQDTTEPANYTAWKEKKLLLNNPTVEEIIYYLEDNYGKKIILNNPVKRKVKIEGPILLTNLDDALFIVSTVLKANIEKYDSTIVITPR